MNYLAVVGIVAVILFLALLWKPRVPWIATAALLVAFAYIGARLVIYEIAERRIARELATTALMASPNPLDPTRWDFVARTGDVYRFGRFTFRDGSRSRRSAFRSRSHHRNGTPRNAIPRSRAS
ncbi:MAG TPA: hypothetical protein VGQ36_26075 [Thermoanaerobaculia bacterium]|jgi:hypothetical protein|nr:hypothetical protein [Thermoanaerobaculia bacterium]